MASGIQVGAVFAGLVCSKIKDLINSDRCRDQWLGRTNALIALMITTVTTVTTVHVSETSPVDCHVSRERSKWCKSIVMVSWWIYHVIRWKRFETLENWFCEHFCQNVFSEHAHFVRNAKTRVWLPRESTLKGRRTCEGRYLS